MNRSPFSQRGQFCFQGSCDRCYGRGIRCRRNLEEALGAMLDFGCVKRCHDWSGKLHFWKQYEWIQILKALKGDISWHVFICSHLPHDGYWYDVRFWINLHPLSVSLHRFYSATFPRISELVLALLRILLTACGKPQFFCWNKSGRTLLEFSDENGLLSVLSLNSLNLPRVFSVYSAWYAVQVFSRY